MIKATKPELPLYEEYINEIKSIWENGALTNNGPKLQKFRAELSSYIGNENVEAFVNGHTALLIAIKTMDLPQGGEVLTSPFTFVSTTNAIVQAGLVPVFCDIDDSYNISLESIERNITDKTCAIITPHIFGIPCHVNEIQKIADNNGLKVIYDGAQAFGTKIDEINIGNFGDMTMFSLHAIKVFNSVEGGVLVYKDSEKKEKLELYRNFGIQYGESNDVTLIGLNGKMTELSAAMGIINLKHIDEVSTRRKKIANYYKERLFELPGITPYNCEANVEYNNAYFPVRIDEKKIGMSRDELWRRLQSNEIQTRKLYDTLTCDYTIYKGQGYRIDANYAREIAKICLDLPMYSDLQIEDIDEIVDAIKCIIR